LYPDVERATAAEYLRDQYATPDKLDIRIQAHQRYAPSGVTHVTLTRAGARAASVEDAGRA
jgi:hypothetical protein